MVHHLQSLLVVGVQIFFSFSPKKKRFNSILWHTFHDYLYICSILKLLWTIQHVPLLYIFSQNKKRNEIFFLLNEQENFSKQNKLTNKKISQNKTNLQTSQVAHKLVKKHAKQAKKSCNSLSKATSLLTRTTK